MQKKKEKKIKVRKTRKLTDPEREYLFVMYDKHNGNMLAMSRDPASQFKAYNLIRTYVELYNFHELYLENRQKQAKEVMEGLEDAKIMTLKRAMMLVQTRHSPIKGKYGNYITDKKGKPMMLEIEPDYKEIEMAWKIIKTELGEATSIGKNDLTIKNRPIKQSPEGIELANRALDLFFNLNAKDSTPNTSKRHK